MTELSWWDRVDALVDFYGYSDDEAVSALIDMGEDDEE